jgi:hypothetical protein
MIIQARYGHREVVIFFGSWGRIAGGVVVFFAMRETEGVVMTILRRC